MMERNKSLYWTLVIISAVVLGFDTVLLMRMPDTSPSQRIALAAIVSVVIIFMALLIYMVPKMEATDVNPSSKKRKRLITPVPDPDGWVRIKTGDYEGYVKEEYLQ